MALGNLISLNLILSCSVCSNSSRVTEREGEKEGERKREFSLSVEVVNTNEMTKKLKKLIVGNAFKKM